MRSMVLGLVLLVVSSASAQEARQPNIVFILADDLGWTDLGCQGSKYYETPNIDRLAQAGMRFTSAYSAGPNCQPTRAAILSGQYGPRTGVYTVGGTERFDTSQRPLVPVENVQNLPLDRMTFAQALKSAGYVTGMFGKWHLGQMGEYHPSKRGFDEAIVTMGKHYGFTTQPKVDVPKGAYLADWLTDQAEAFIVKHQKRPFLLYLPHFGVHSPFEAKKELIEKFKNKPGVGGHKDPTYAAMIASVDESVGRVLDLLEKLKLSENTLVIFSSDNGGVGGYLEVGLKTKEGITANRPLRGGKGMLYEGGVRVAFIAAFKGKIRPNSTNDEPIISVDLFPTLLELGRAKAPSQTLDGKSLVPLFTGERFERQAIYWHFPGYLGSGKNEWRTTPGSAVRAGDWKLQEYFEDGRIELYNLKTDLGQAKNLAETEPVRRDELLTMLRQWRTAVNAPMPMPRQKK